MSQYGLRSLIHLVHLAGVNLFFLFFFCGGGWCKPCLTNFMEADGSVTSVPQDFGQSLPKDLSKHPYHHRKCVCMNKYYVKRKKTVCKIFTFCSVGSFFFFSFVQRVESSIENRTIVLDDSSVAEEQSKKTSKVDFICLLQFTYNLLTFHLLFHMSCSIDKALIAVTESSGNL